MRATSQVPADVEEYRDQCWRREGTRRVETAFEAERFIEQVGFAFCMTDCRRPGPSLVLSEKSAEDSGGRGGGLPLFLFECVAFFIDDYFDPAERPTRLHAYVWAPDFDAALDFSGDHFSRRVQPCHSSELVGPAGAERLPDLRACAVRYARRATNNSQSRQQG